MGRAVGIWRQVKFDDDCDSEMEFGAEGGGLGNVQEIRANF